MLTVGCKNSLPCDGKFILPRTLIREIREELEAEIAVGDLIKTIEYDYPDFHLSMDCFLAEVISGELVLKEAEAARWLAEDELDSVKWLPADRELINKIKRCGYLHMITGQK